VIVDGKISTTGTANMDFRSYELNYEVNAVIYDDEITQELEEDFNRNFEKCHLMTLEEYEKTSIVSKLFEAFVRVFSSLL
jgi:cardiolipin synthase